jgi:hypothetical protein
MRKSALTFILAACMPALAEETMLERAIRVDAELNSQIQSSIRRCEELNQALITSLYRAETESRLESIDRHVREIARDTCSGAEFSGDLLNPLP